MGVKYRTPIDPEHKDRLSTPPTTKAYEEGWDRIFGKKQKKRKKNEKIKRIKS